MLVLITNHVEFVYSDAWNGDELHYTGMGQKGDQSLLNIKSIANVSFMEIPYLSPQMIRYLI